ncbi:MAG: cytochrome P450 [Alphaproteobacteria bacterium]|nr:cytochrome P450 [Alphaproteobacteria bacterium]
MGLIEGHMAIEPPDGVPVWDVDPYDPVILANPDDYYAELREKGPFAYIPKYSILACGRHDETHEVFSDWERFVSSRGVGLQDFSLETPWRPPSLVLEVDPPYHSRTRKILVRALSPKATAALADKFQSAADTLIDALVEKGRFEAVEDLAEAYPISVFPGAVGFRQPDKRRLIDYGAMVFNALGPDNELRRTAMARGPDIVPWITEQCRRENLDASGFGATIYAAADEGEITEEEAGMLVRSLLSAGVDTTVTGLGSTLWCFATFPDQFEKLKADPSLLRPAFEEVLRFTTPVHSFCRTANLDTTVSGIEICQGTKILCVLGAANGDERKWPGADRFDISRRPMGHLGMGAGIHNCVGQNLARAEVAAVMKAILNKVDGIELTGKAVWRPNNAIHALDKLPIAFKGK